MNGYEGKCTLVLVMNSGVEPPPVPRAGLSAADAADCWQQWLLYIGLRLKVGRAWLCGGSAGVVGVQFFVCEVIHADGMVCYTTYTSHVFERAQ